MSLKKVLVASASSPIGLTVAIALAKHGNFVVRGFVDDVLGITADQSRDLKNNNIEIVKGSMLQKNRVVEALMDIDYVFLNTEFFNAPGKEEREFDEGRIFIDSCKEQNIKHIVYCTPGNCEVLAQGKFPIPELESKCKVTNHLKNSGLNHTILNTGFPMYRLKDFVVYKPDEKVYEFDIPMSDKNLDVLAPEDLAAVVCTIFDNPDQFKNQCISVASDSLSIERMAEIFSKVTHKPARYPEMSVKHFKEETNFPNKEQMGNLFHLFQDFSGKLVDIKKTQEILPNLHSFEQWLLGGNWELEAERR